MNPKTRSQAPVTDRSTSPYSRPVTHGFLAALLGLMAGLSACSGKPETPTQAPQPGQPVRVAAVADSRPLLRMRVPGVVRAIQRADLAFLHDGHLAERLVGRGETVAAGQGLAILHNPALMPGVTAAEARVRELDEQLQQLERETRRLSDLREREMVSADELDRVRARRNAARQARIQAQARLEEAREQLADATLRAPFAGRIVDLPVEPGDYIGPGQPVISISAPERLEVAVDLSARQAKALAVDDPATIHRIEGGERVTGTIREIGLAAPGRAATAIVDLPGAAWPAWAPGQAVHVALSRNEAQSLAVPLDALVDTGDGLPHVFRLRQGRAELVGVIPGQLDGGRVRIDAGLQPGDEVIVAGHGQLLDGERVRVLR